MNISYKSKSIIMAVICGVLVIAIGITVYFLIDSLDGNNALEVKKENEMKMYAVVLKTGNIFVKVEPIDGDEEVHINTTDKLNEGDFVVITYNEDEEASITPNNIEVIAKNKEVTVVANTSTTKTTTKSVYVSTTEKTTKTTTSTSKSTSKRVTTKQTTTVISDDDIVALAKLNYEEADKASKDKSITASIKEKFVLFIDFIFYDGKIKGKTFKELSDSAKAKVVYYMLLADSKIDSKWPDYKNTIKNKASNLKEKLIAKYMDITTNICENHTEGCQRVKEDFTLLKKSLNLTWDVIKSAFSYGYNKTYTYLKNWYEVWREK